MPARWGQQTTPSSRQRQDTGPGILWSVNRWTKPGLDGANLVITIPNNFKKKKGPYNGPVLLLKAG